MKSFSYTNMSPCPTLTIWPPLMSLHLLILHPNVSFYPHIKTIYPNPDHCILLEVL